MTDNQERERIVAWLRERQRDCTAAASEPDNDDDDIQTCWVVRAEAYGFAADRIESGVHAS